MSNTKKTRAPGNRLRSVTHGLLFAAVSLMTLNGHAQTTWNADGSVKVAVGKHDDPILIHTYAATEEAEVRQIMAHANLAYPFLQFNDQHQGGILIESAGDNAEVKLEIFAYDKNKPGGKGDLIYGCKATKNGFHEDTWKVDGTAPHWWSSDLKSNDMTKLMQNQKIYMPETCKAPYGGHPTLAAIGIGMGGLVLGAVIGGAGVLLAPVTGGGSLIGAGAVITSLATAGGGMYLGTEAYFSKPECKQYGIPYQPVVIELHVKNATVKSLNIPGSRQHVTPEDVFFSVYPRQHYCATNEHAVPCKIFADLRTLNLSVDEDLRVLAHRGYWGNDLGRGVPENSAGAINYAHQQGVNTIEVDVMPTLTAADGTPESLVLLHDYNLERLTTDQSGKFTFTKSEAELTTLNLKRRNESVSAEKLISVNTLLDLCKSNNMVVFMDLKELQSNGEKPCKGNCAWADTEKKKMSWMRNMKKAIDMGTGKAALQHMAFKTYYDYQTIQESLTQYGLDPDDLKRVFYMPMIVSSAEQWKTNGVPDVQKICDFVDRWYRDARRNLAAFETNYFTDDDVLLQKFTRGKDADGKDKEYKNVLEYIALTTGLRSGIFSEEPVGPEGTTNRWGTWKMKDTSTDRRADHEWLIAPPYAKYMLITTDRPDIWKQLSELH